MAMHYNVEIKARCTDLNKMRRILRTRDAREIGLDHQVDTYFRVPHGRLKLREGNLENSLIHYRRPDQPGPKTSEVTLYTSAPKTSLKEVLSAALEVWKVVDKKREIYFIDNVKFHLDEVQHLGTFVEIEAIDREGTLGLAHLRKQCAYYLQMLEISTNDLVDQSYSDLI